MLRRRRIVGRLVHASAAGCVAAVLAAIPGLTATVAGASTPASHRARADASTATPNPAQMLPVGPDVASLASTLAASPSAGSLSPHVEEARVGHGHATATRTAITPNVSVQTTCSTSTSPAPPVNYLTAPEPENTYYLAENDGSLANYGGASFYGSAVHVKLQNTMIGAASTADGDGYWIATSRGSVRNYGDAHFYGSPANAAASGKLAYVEKIVAFGATPDGGGYWLVGSGGAIYNYGDAAFCGSAVHERLASPIVGLAATPDGKGYWLVTEDGVVYSFGDAPSLPAATKKFAGPIVSIASSVDGKGYWLVSSGGNVYSFGDAGFFGSPVHKRFTKPVAQITPTDDGQGYWITTAEGQIFNYGDAPFHGSLVHARVKAPNAVVALFRRPVPPPPPAPTATPSPSPVLTSTPGIVHGVFGYDISNYQCSTSDPSAASPNLPPASGISVVEVAGWLDSSQNSCLAAEATWATSAAGTTGNAYELYLFVNSPGTTAAAQSQSAAGPAGTCSTLSQSSASQGQPSPAATCAAYNYGYNGAKQALATASSAGVSSSIWWLDVEGANLSSTANSNFPSTYWSDSTTLNDQTIQGALDALHQASITAGIYSTSPQYATIAGDFTPSGPQIPLWVAGVPWTNPPYTESGLNPTSSLAAWCAGTAVYGGTTDSVDFAGGIPMLLQETPGNEASPYGIDPDYTC